MIQNSLELNVNYKSKLKKSKFRPIDKTLDYDNCHIKSLTNDIPISELRFGEANESESTSKKHKSKELDTPTPVMLVNFRKGKSEIEVCIFKFTVC